ncbi:MAG TPA: hypothetical protein PLW93_06210 [Candidatus Absconditabacterales bacterium]|nr:hypothetical protein [Candidatus Absconditabacterales bacterium]HNG97842.1 hypothetical protein [Candidatus Absconditabacterales bacterium]
MTLGHYEHLEDIFADATSSLTYNNKDSFRKLVSNKGDTIFIKDQGDRYQIISAITASGMALYGKALRDLLLWDSALRNHKFNFVLDPEAIITNPIHNPTLTDRGGRNITVG